MTYYWSQIIDGIATGCLYGLLALSVVFIYRSSKVINFSLGESATFSTIIYFFLTKALPWELSLILTLGISFGFGFLIHYLVMSQITEREGGGEINEVIVTIGFLMIFNSLSNFAFGKEIKELPSFFGLQTVEILGVPLSQHSLGIILTCACLSSLLFLFFRYSRIGKIMEGVSENRLAARLRGINVPVVLALGWGGAAAIAALAGIMSAPLLFLRPGMLLSSLLYAFTAAVIGGINSPFGALAGGIIVGVIENISGTWSIVGSELKLVVVFFALVAFLLMRPRGLFAKQESRRI